MTGGRFLSEQGEQTKIQRAAARAGNAFLNEDYAKT
jgi:hypothetical protein